MKLVIFSICLNEEKTVKELITRLPKKIDGIDEIEVFIVDDGSSDGTSEIAKRNGVKVFSNGTQKRLAYSFQRAVDLALTMEADIAVNIDGDLQYSPEEIPLLVRPILDGKADFVTANRFTDIQGGHRNKPQNMPRANFLGNKLGSWVVSRLTGKSFKDVTSGFRAYNRKALMSLNINGKYTYTQESFQVLAMKNLSISQVPVSIKYFKGRKSRVVSSIFRFITNSAINIVRSFRDFAPLVFFGWVGFVAVMIGSCLGVSLLMYYIHSGSFTPYKYIGVIGLFMIGIGIVVWIVGLVGDMLDRVLNNQEKILYMLKEQKYSNLGNRKKQD